MHSSSMLRQQMQPGWLSTASNKNGVQQKMKTGLNDSYVAVAALRNFVMERFHPLLVQRPLVQRPLVQRPLVQRPLVQRLRHSGTC